MPMHSWSLLNQLVSLMPIRPQYFWGGGLHGPDFSDRALPEVKKEISGQVRLGSKGKLKFQPVSGLA